MTRVILLAPATGMSRPLPQETQARCTTLVFLPKNEAGADTIAFALVCLNDREREMVHLVEVGYPHAEVAEMMGYTGARSVTTTMNRIRVKITEHVSSREEVEELLRTSS